MKHRLPKRSHILALFFAFALAGCSLVGDDVRGEVTGEAEPAAAPPALVLKNSTNRTVHYGAYETGGLATITLSPPASCRGGATVAAGETARVPYDAIVFYREGDVGARVFWCTANGEADGYFNVSLE